MTKKQANTVSDQDKGELGIVVAGTPVTLAMLHEHLSARPLCAHRVWQREVFKSLKELLAQNMEQSASMLKLLEYSWLRLKVYETAQPLAGEKIMRTASSHCWRT